MKADVMLVIALVFLNAASGQDSAADKVKAERKALAGRWVCESSEVNGIKRGGRESAGQTFTFAGEKFTQADAATGDVIQGTYQLDLTGKHRVLSTKVVVGTKEFTIRYIYERDGDKLKVCANLLPRGELPTEFSAPEGSRRMAAMFRQTSK
jgi:uncharacterized protein (TIGR03067 family)